MMQIGRYIMGALYVIAGIAHFVVTRAYERIIPDYIPAHHSMVIVSGVAEIAGGIGLMVPQARRAAAWEIVALLIAVSPCHIWMLQHAERYSDVPLWALWVRLPLQLVLIAWAWRYTRVNARTTQ